MKDYDLVVSIVTYHSPLNFLKNIILLLKNIDKLKICIVIIDNGSKLDYFKSLLSLDAYIISAGKNLGYGMANNLVNDISYKSKYFLVLNPDIQISTNVIIELYNFMEKNPIYSLISPLLKNDNNKYYNIFRENFSFINLLTRRLFKNDDTFFKNIFFNKIKNFHEIIDVKYISGSFMFFRRESFVKIGGFNKVFFMYFEDVEICDVLIKNNFKIGFLKNFDSIHLRNRESYKKIKSFLIHFHSWIKYKFFSRTD